MACDVEVQSEGATDTAEYEVGQFSTGVLKASKIVADWVSGNKTICAIGLKVREVGTATNNIKVGIWSHNSGDDEPDALIDESDFEPMSNLAASAAEYVFTGNLAALLTHGTTYWIVITASSFDNSNYVEMMSDAVMTTESIQNSVDSGATWTELTGVRGLWFWLYEDGETPIATNIEILVNRV